MKLPEIALKNYLFVLTAVALLIFLGIRTYNSMPRSEDPFLSLPNYTIVVVYPGTSPQDMEELVVDPIEEVIEEIDNIEEIRTEIANGLAVIQVQGEFGGDYDAQYDDILAEINQVRGELPSGILTLDVTQYKPEDRVAVHQYAFVSETLPYSVLYDYAEDFEEMLKKIPEIKKVEIEANPQEEIRISLDFQKMSTLSITLGQVIQKLQQNNANIPGGKIDGGNLSFNLKSSGSFESLDQLRNMAVFSQVDQIVYLKDIATVAYDYEDPRWIARFKGSKAIHISVLQKRGTNILELADKLATIKKDFEEETPSVLQIETAFEQAP
ncbi:MAG: efflux RND transporter permease subunit, partial [Bacteroidota bacterium]